MMDYAACLCTLNLMREGQGQEEMFPSLLDQPPQSLVDSHLLRRVPIEMEHSLEVVLYDPDSLHVVSSVWHWGLCPSGYISRAVRLSIVKSEECEWLDDFGLGVNLFSCVQIYLMPMYSTEPYGLW